MKRHFLALIPLAVFILLVGLFAAPLLRGKDPAKLESAMIGKTVPSFTLPATVPGGDVLSDAQLKTGDITLVNFFASWCVPCRAEQPVLEAIAARGDVVIYGVNYKDKQEDVIDWLRKYGNPFRAIGFDAEGRVSIDWGVYGVPETYLISKTGQIRYRHVGPLTPDVYNNILRPLIAELQK